jgi:hypothetical protein
MEPTNYFAYLHTLIGDDAAIDAEKSRLDKITLDVSATIKAGMTAQSVPSLIWHLAMKEIARVQPLVGIPVSNFAGQARLLRAISASIPFDSVDIGDDPGTDRLLELCGQLWQVMFFREMIDDLKRADRTEQDAEKRRIAAVMSLIDAVQLEGAYTDQAEERIRTQFGKFSKEVIEPQLGLSVDDVIRGFRFLRAEIPRRLNTAQDLMEPLIKEWQAFRELADDAADRYFRELARRIPDREALTCSFRAGLESLNRLLVLTPDEFKTELGNRAALFLSEFSFVPGKVNCEVATPFDADVVRARPFAKLKGDQFLLFDVFYAPFAPLYRLAECFKDRAHMQRLLRHRDKSLEAHASSLFSPIVERGLKLANYYVPVGEDGRLAERDLLFFRDGILLLVESKAKPLRPISVHRGNVRKIEGDVKASIQAGYDQACSVWDHIAKSDGEVVFFDSNKADRKEVGRLDPKAVRDVQVIVFVDSYCGLIGTDLEPWLTRDEAVGFPWVVDRDTWETIALKINTFETLTSFLSWRRRLHGKVFNEDETVFAGYFIRHGNAPFPEGASLVQLDANYVDVFEFEYFQRKGIPVEPPPAGSKEPLFVSMRREGSRLIKEMDGKIISDIDSFAANKKANFGKRYSTLLKRRKPTAPTLHPVRAHRSRVGRNDPCPCGSGLKFKKCCLRQRR